MAMINCGRKIPLPDAIQRSRAVFDSAMKAYFKTVSKKSPGKEGMRMRPLAARVAFKVSLIFRNFMQYIVTYSTFPFASSIRSCRILFSYMDDASSKGGLVDVVSTIRLFCGDVAKLLHPGFL